MLSGRLNLNYIKSLSANMHPLYRDTKNLGMAIIINDILKNSIKI
jgi:hypothetical protein